MELAATRGATLAWRRHGTAPPSMSGVFSGASVTVGTKHDEDDFMGRHPTTTLVTAQHGRKYVTRLEAVFCESNTARHRQGV